MAAETERALLTILLHTVTHKYVNSFRLAKEDSYV
jgi:hypothetical protein